MNAKLEEFFLGEIQLKEYWYLFIELLAGHHLFKRTSFMPTVECDPGDYGILKIILDEASPIEREKFILNRDMFCTCRLALKNHGVFPEQRFFGQTFYAAIVRFGYWLLNSGHADPFKSGYYIQLCMRKEFHYIMRDRPGLFVLCFPACVPRLKRSNWLPVDLFRLLASYL